jgi:methyl-accepting chemotaxis protein
MRLTTRLYLLVGMLLTGIILSSLFAFYAVANYKEAGMLTKQVIVGKDLESSLTPPALSLLEQARLAAFIDTGTVSDGDLQQYAVEYNELKKEYEKSLDWVRTTVPDTESKRLLLGPFDRNVQAYFKIWETQLWPAVQAHNTAEVARIETGPMRVLFKESTALNKQIYEAQLSIQQERMDAMAQGEKNADNAGKLSLWLSCGMILLGMLLSILVGRSVHRALKEIAVKLAQVSKEINSQIDTQGASVAQLSISVNQTTTSMDELNASFYHTESLAAESSSRAKNAFQHSDEGNALTKEMLEGLTLHKDKVAAIVEQIARLSEITHQIHSVAAATSNLTNQTNILALNAAVQSAHVKQQTEGFAVIASEIRKLADESKKFLSHIDLLAGNIKHATDATMTLALDGQKTLQDSIKLAQSVSKSFNSIMTINNGSFEGAEQVVLNVKQQLHAVQQVLGAMEIVNNVSQETVSGMNQVRQELGKLNDSTSTLNALV